MPKLPALQKPSQPQQKQKTAFEIQMQANLERERRYYEEMVGIADDNSVVDLEELKRQIWNAES